MMASHEIRPAKGKMRSLPLDLWPEADCNAWNAACRPAARPKPGGAAGHLRPVAEIMLGTTALPEFSTGVGCCNQAAATNVTPDNVDAYPTELKARVGQ